MNSKVYLDANVLIAHQVKGHKYYQKAKDLISALWEEGESLVISSLTVDEWWFGLVTVLRQSPKMKAEPFSAFAPQVQKSIEAIFSWGNIELVSFQSSESEVFEVLRLIKRFNLRPRDAFHLRTMQQQDMHKIATFDQDFIKVTQDDLVEIFS